MPCFVAFYKIIQFEELKKSNGRLRRNMGSVGIPLLTLITHVTSNILAAQDTCSVLATIVHEYCAHAHIVHINCARLTERIKGAMRTRQKLPGRVTTASIVERR